MLTTHDREAKPEGHAVEDVLAKEKKNGLRVNEEVSLEQRQMESRIMYLPFLSFLPLANPLTLLRRKVDWRLIPILGLLYSVAGLDRVNLSNARVSGMNEDLGFNIGDRYSIALLVFFITYFLFELPSTLAMRYVGPRLQLSALAVSWGLVMLGMGFVNDWKIIVVCRMLIGIFEAGKLFEFYSLS